LIKNDKLTYFDFVFVVFIYYIDSLFFYKMNPITIKGTYKTPDIVFDIKKGEISIKGRSLPENASLFYKPLLDILFKISENKSSIVVNIHLEYINANSRKFFIEIFRNLEALIAKGVNVMINWFYDDPDEDIYEAGMDYSSMVNIPFKIQES